MTDSSRTVRTPRAPRETEVWAFLLPVAVLGYTAYRLGLTVAAVRADRAGDTERAQSLREKAFYFGRGSSCLMLLLFFVVVVAILVL